MLHSLSFWGYGGIFLLLHLFHESDEVIETEGAPGGGIEVVVGEGVVILRPDVRST